MSVAQVREFPVGDDATDAGTFAWSPDGARVAVLARLVRKVSLFDARSGSPVATLDDLAGGTTSIGFTADGRVVAGPRGEQGGGAFVWTPGSGDVRPLPSPEGKSDDPVTSRLSSFAIDPAGQRLIGIHRARMGQGYTSRLALYDLAALSLVTTGGGPASQVAIASGGQKAAIVGQDGQVGIIDLATGAQILHINAHLNAVLHVAWSADGRHIATATMGEGFGLDRRTGQHGPLRDTELLKLWDATTGELVAVGDSVSGGVVSLDFSRDGKWLAVADAEGNVRLLDARSLREARVIASEGKPATQEVRFSPDSRLLGRLRTGPRQLAIHDVAAALKGN